MDQTLAFGVLFSITTGSIILGSYSSATTFRDWIISGFGLRKFQPLMFSLQFCILISAIFTMAYDALAFALPGGWIDYMHHIDNPDQYPEFDTIMRELFGLEVVFRVFLFSCCILSNCVSLFKYNLIRRSSQLPDVTWGYYLLIVLGTIQYSMIVGDTEFNFPVLYESSQDIFSIIHSMLFLAYGLTEFALGYSNLRSVMSVRGQVTSLLSTGEKTTVLAVSSSAAPEILDIKDTNRIISERKNFKLFVGFLACDFIALNITGFLELPDPFLVRTQYDAYRIVRAVRVFFCVVHCYASLKQKDLIAIIFA
jgi:hypothetical protein